MGSQCIEYFLMARRKPPPRIVTLRSRNNANRRLRVALPHLLEREALAARISYGPYSKHKYNPGAYGLAPYAGQDTERTYCDAHAQFGKADRQRIPALLKRGVMLGLWSDQGHEDAPSLIWTIDDNGWIFELRITNATQAEYHGYPVLQTDAFAKQVLIKARDVAILDGQFPYDQDPTVQVAIAAAEAFYR